MFANGRFAAIHRLGDGVVGDFLHCVQQNRASLVLRQIADGPKDGRVLLGR